MRGVNVVGNNSGQIGPHEDKEFELFESGQKDLIYFAWDWQPENHKDTAKKLGANLLIFEDSDSKLPNYIYYRRGLSNKAKELRDIIMSDMRITDSDWAEKEHKIGELLGYSKQDVELFLSSFQKP